jgi:hypothetical protein
MTRKAAVITLTLLVLAAWGAFLIFWLPGLLPDRTAALWTVLGSFGVPAAIVVSSVLLTHNMRALAAQVGGLMLFNGLALLASVSHFDAFVIVFVTLSLVSWIVGSVVQRRQRRSSEAVTARPE